MSSLVRYPIMKEHSWYALSDKWILVQRFKISKLQFTDHRKLKKEHQSGGVLVPLRKEQNTHRSNYGDKMWSTD